MSFFVLKKINEIQVAGKNFWLVYYYVTIKQNHTVENIIASFSRQKDN